MNFLIGTFELDDRDYEGIRVFTPTHAFVLIQQRGAGIASYRWSAAGVYHLAGDILTFYPRYYSHEHLAVPLTWRIRATPTGVREAQITGDATPGREWMWRRIEPFRA
ncbi:MAG: hypothetical protein HOP15_00075 [Planctomycetes bacterium]|nr:hypothetical protein [Planctomycetota bacterium]